MSSAPRFDPTLLGPDIETESENEAPLLPDSTTKKKRGRPKKDPFSKKNTSKGGGGTLQVVGDAETSPISSIAPSISVELNISDSVVSAIPTMDVTIPKHRRFYSNSQKEAVAAYAAIIGRNKAADELQLSRPLVGKWVKLHGPKNNPPVDLESCIQNGTAALLAENVHRVISQRVVLPPGLNMSQVLNGEKSKRSRGKKWKGKKVKRKKSNNSEERMGLGDDSASVGGSTASGSEIDDDDNDFMNEFINVDGDEGEPAFETAFAAIREAARVAIAGNLQRQ
ncbi:hypothetical protein BDR26DRAFT_856296 [Obelidium mucronatum]|nr:hypothetical protein BDR26DRAFT_856296 [Obelidium mucronatum]